MVKVYLTVWTLAVLSFIPLVLSQTARLVVNDPKNATQCEPTTLTWEGGTPPFNVTVHPGAGSFSDNAIQTFPPQQNRSVQWTVNVEAGAQFYVVVRDNNNLANSSSAGDVASSSNHTCLPSPPQFRNTTPSRAVVIATVVSLFTGISIIAGCLLYLRHRHNRRHRYPQSPWKVRTFNGLGFIAHLKDPKYPITPFPLPTEPGSAVTQTPTFLAQQQEAEAEEEEEEEQRAPTPPPKDYKARSHEQQASHIEHQIQALQDQINRLSQALSHSFSSSSSFDTTSENQRRLEKDLRQLVDQARGKIHSLQEQRRSLRLARSYDEAPPQYEEA